MLFNNICGEATIDEVAARPEMRYVPKAMLEQWKAGAAQFRAYPGSDSAGNKQTCYQGSGLSNQCNSETRGNQSQAARLLNISRDALRYKIRKFNLK